MRSLRQRFLSVGVQGLSHDCDQISDYACVFEECVDDREGKAGLFAIEVRIVFRCIQDEPLNHNERH